MYLGFSYVWQLVEKLSAVACYSTLASLYLLVVMYYQQNKPASFNCRQNRIDIVAEIRIFFKSYSQL